MFNPGLVRVGNETAERIADNEFGRLAIVRKFVPPTLGNSICRPRNLVRSPPPLFNPGLVRVGNETAERIADNEFGRLAIVRKLGSSNP